MNVGNGPVYHYLFDLLQPQQSDKLLEIGFGNGKFLERFVDMVPQGLVAGIDISNTMVKTALVNNKKLVAKGILKLQLAPVSNIPYPDSYFDHVITINTLYFWKDPEKDILEVYRVIRPEGSFSLAFVSENSMRKGPYDKNHFTLWSKNRAKMLLDQAGFKNVTCENYFVGKDEVIFLLATK